MMAGSGRPRFCIFCCLEELPRVHRIWDKHKDTGKTWPCSQVPSGGLSPPMEGCHCLLTALVAATLCVPLRGAALQEPLGSALP